ncbi:protein FAM177A1-like isoform X3 [Bacillus rossius redtenbacheri]
MNVPEVNQDTHAEDDVLHTSHLESPIEGTCAVVNTTSSRINKRKSWVTREEEAFKIMKSMMEGGVPRPRGRLLHFSDGTLEDHSSDEEHSTDEERPNEVPVDPKTLTWRPWMWYYVSTAGCKTLQVCDYLGESLAHFFGITSPKYQYEIEEYYRAKAEEEEYKKKQDLEMRGWLEKPTGVKVEEPLSVSRVEQADGNRAENIGELTTLL